MGAAALRLATLLLIPCGLFAQIAFDNATDGGDNGGNTSSRTFSHTVNTGPALLGICFLGDSITGVDDILSVTSDATSMSLVQKFTGTGGQNTNRFTYLYMLANVAAGAHSIVVTANSNHYLIPAAASWSGAATSGQPEASQVFTAENTVNPYTTALSTVTNNAWMVLCDGGANVTASTGVTKRVQNAGFGEPFIGDSNAAITPVQSYSMSTSFTTGGVADVHIMASIKLPGGAGATLHLLTLLGVGN